MADTQTKKENSKDGLALIIGGLFILALVFATYNYFNKSNKTNKVAEIQQESVFESGSAKGDLNGGGAKTQAVNKTTVNKTTTTGPTGTGGQISGAPTGGWVANDYVKGDIKGASYTVKTGDTLWEIAEGAYGNGAEWTKILEANKSSIGFLPNGSQALIRPGQVLVLP